MSIKKFDRAACRTVSEAAMEALAPLAEEHGLEVKRGSGSFSEGEFSFKITFKAEGADEKEFASTASLVGLTTADYHAEIQYGGRTFKIVGINLRARKYPVNVEEVRTGKKYKLPVSAVARSLGREPNPLWP